MPSNVVKCRTSSGVLSRTGVWISAAWSLYFPSTWAHGEIRACPSRNNLTCGMVGRAIFQKHQKVCFDDGNDWLFPYNFSELPWRSFFSRFFCKNDPFWISLTHERTRNLEGGGERFLRVSYKTKFFLAFQKVLNDRCQKCLNHWKHEQ